MELAGDELRLERGYTTETADFGWFVVELP
jgi:hypothetical protein